MQRNFLRLFFGALLVAAFVPKTFAQLSTCEYTLILNDTYGDGWNGGTLTVTSGASSMAFTLPTGFTDTVPFLVTNGVSLTFTWVQGSFLGEVGYVILDNVGNVVSQANAPFMPATGTLYTGIGACVTCSSPRNFVLENVWDTYAKLRWNTDPNGPNPAVGYQIIYGLQGFDLAAGEGDTVTTTQTKITLTGLQKKTWYDAYILQDCGVANGFSSVTGPVSFETYWTKDVGISGIVSPNSGCDLGLDTVRVLLKNYGAAPQSLIPLRYTINGEEVPISKPADGFYTGVLGKDSAEVFFFETVFDFSEPGEYTIVAYTKFTGDQDLSNDTFVYRINNRLVTPYTQNFEDWNGGWNSYSESGPNSWAFGAPSKTSIPSAASGQNAWVTNLTGPYAANELSYLESPCFDFTELAYDPALSFSIIHQIESGYDGAWLELSTDNGATWTKVGALNEGLNWYNEDVSDGTMAGETWTNTSGGWLTARHFLTGTAGESEVRFRFVFASDPSVNLGGLGIDDVRVFPAFSKDLLGVKVSVASEGLECGLEDDEVSFTFLNGGNLNQDGYQIAYAVNGGTPVIQNVPGTAIIPDEARTITFNATFDSRDALSVIKCWTILNGDFAHGNDTATLVVNYQPKPAPFHEDFESQTVPSDWLVNGFVTNAHGNTSFVLATNLYSFNPEFVHDLPRYGYISANDSISFSYRITNYTGGGPLLLGLNTFELQVSTDCGETYQTINTINSFNHTPTVNMRTRKVALAQFAGQAVKFRFLGTWSSGDFWFDLDNVNLLSCAADMALSADVVPAAPGQSNGSATVQVGLGNPPFSYEWSNDSTGQTVTGLASGTYTVTVSDAFGCSDVFEFSVGTSAVENIDGLQRFSVQPNPSSGQVQIQVSLQEAASALQIQVLDLLGRPVFEANAGNTGVWNEQLDLSAYPDGIYLLRLTVDGKSAVKKLVKSR
ncbi:MAG: T9SS type A sorting domain-containing protein [Saprospiraceae bacterium]|nr:T9SS type A sorting domain-containing protein [Saprospiraceae bacterium]